MDRRYFSAHAPDVELRSLENIISESAVMKQLLWVFREDRAIMQKQLFRKRVSFWPYSQLRQVRHLKLCIDRRFQPFLVELTQYHSLLN